LLQNTANAALAFAAGKPLGAGIVSAQIAEIVCATSRTIFTTKLMLATGLVLMVGALVVGAGASLPLPSRHGQGANTAKETPENPAPQSMKRKAPSNASAKPPLAKGAQAAASAVSKDLVVRGRVLDPE